MELKDSAHLNHQGALGTQGQGDAAVPPFVGTYHHQDSFHATDTYANKQTNKQKNAGYTKH